MTWLIWSFVSRSILGSYRLEERMGGGAFTVPVCDRQLQWSKFTKSVILFKLNTSGSFSTASLGDSNNHQIKWRRHGRATHRWLILLYSVRSVFKQFCQFYVTKNKASGIRINWLVWQMYVLLFSLPQMRSSAPAPLSFSVGNKQDLLWHVKISAMNKTNTSSEIDSGRAREM